MKYLIDATLSENDCSFCPFFQQYLNEEAECNLAERELTGELRKSKSRVCDSVMCFDIPEWCPLVPLKKAKPYVNHGDHGPEPLFDGDAWTVWHCCGRCHHPVSHGDRCCRTCGAILDWDDDWGDTDG